jgi:ABC-type microcin C transport system duplicated ATPase subunit YejF
MSLVAEFDLAGLTGFGWFAKDRRDRAIALLEEVGLESRYLRRYPHEFSGGQPQRICT